MLYRCKYRFAVAMGVKIDELYLKVLAGLLITVLEKN